MALKINIGQIIQNTCDSYFFLWCEFFSHNAIFLQKK